MLTNIAASDYTMLVAECGAVPKLVDLLASPNASIRHQVKQCYSIVHPFEMSFVLIYCGSDMLNRLHGPLEI